MRIGVPAETAPGERRVALVPDNVTRLVAGGATLVVQRGAGRAASFPDEAYEAAGATMADDDDAVRDCEVVVRVQSPDPAAVASMREGTVLICLLQPQANPPLLDALLQRRITALSLERVPRITRAQSMDVLSSQATVAGYKAVLMGAALMPRFLPMLTTAAGNIAPAKAFVLGAGVAGLMAIATARRLGAVVSAFDVRPVVKEQVQSLGATFVAAEALAADAETSGGYAKEQSAEQQQRIAQLLHEHLKGMDLVITTAAVPGRPAPTIITEAMVNDMKAGAVIVDLAAESGGNCAVTRAGETVSVNGVLVLGAIDVPASVPTHASQMFGRNVQTLLQHLITENTLSIDLDDDITGPMCVAHAGQSRVS